jgi:hypothetical protein
MTVSFNITQPADKYETGLVSLTATDPREIIQLLEKDRKLKADPVGFSKELAVALSFGNTIYKDPATHFLIESTLVAECTEPYIKGIEKLAGTPIPEFCTAKIDLLPAFADKLSFLHLLKAELDDGHFSFVVAYEDYYVREEMRLDARWQKAERGAVDQLEETLNVRPYHREYIETASGQYKRNPLYATGAKLPVDYCIAFVPLWDLLLLWWKDNVASPRQRAAVEEIIEGGPDKKQAYLLGYGGELRHYPDFTLYLPDCDGPVTYGSGSVPKVRIVRDLSEESLAGWTPGVNINQTTTNI